MLTRIEASVESFLFVVSKTSTIKKIMNVLSLGEVVAVRCGCDLNPKKVAKRAHVGHVKLLNPKKVGG
jgi:hypothetical protein